MIFMKEFFFFKNLILKKISSRRKSMKNFPVGNELTPRAAAGTLRFPASGPSYRRFRHILRWRLSPFSVESTRVTNYFQKSRHSILVGSAVAWWLMPRAPDPEVGGSSPTRVKPCCVLEQGTFTPQKYW